MNAPCAVTTRCVIGSGKPGATQMWEKHTTNGARKKHSLKFKSIFLLCSLLSFINISLNSITRLSEGGDSVANIIINSYWGAIQIRKRALQHTVCIVKWEWENKYISLHSKVGMKAILTLGNLEALWGNFFLALLQVNKIHSRIISTSVPSALGGLKETNTFWWQYNLESSTYPYLHSKRMSSCDTYHMQWQIPEMILSICGFCDIWIITYFWSLQS